MFHHLIRVYHDGILITQQENILYTNQSMIKIFDLDDNENNIDFERSRY